MNREEAIEHLKNMKMPHDKFYEETNEINKALIDKGNESLEMAIESLEVNCDKCKYQIKNYILDKRYKKSGYWVYSCRLNSDQFENHAVDGQPRQYCSSFEAKEKK